METQKNVGQETVEVKNLVSELVPIFKDFFVANVEGKENGIEMSFLSGQTFFVEVREN